MKHKVINIEGKQISDIELSDKIFSIKPNKNVLQRIVDWQINHLKPRDRRRSRINCNSSWKS